MNEKVFKTIDQQIEILKKRNLTFLDEEVAKRILIKTSYYDIINGYKDIFLKQKKDDVKGTEEYYKDSVTFEMVYGLYNFDASLRSLLLRYIDIIENQLGSVLAHVIAANHGHKESQYIDRSIYLKGKKQAPNKFTVDEFINRLHESTNSKKAPIQFYKNRHGYLPPWILFKYLTFGEKEKLFNLLKPQDKQEVLSIFKNNFILTKDFSTNFYVKALVILREFRNTCAHGSRVYNHFHKFEQLPYNHVLEFLEIDKPSSRGKNDITALVTCIYSFLGGDRIIDSNWTAFISEFYKLLEDFEAEFPEEIYEKLLLEMKLPNNFKKLKHI